MHSQILNLYLGILSINFSNSTHWIRMFHPFHSSSQMYLFIFYLTPVPGWFLGVDKIPKLKISFPNLSWKVKTNSSGQEQVWFIYLQITLKVIRNGNILMLHMTIWWTNWWSFQWSEFVKNFLKHYILDILIYALQFVTLFVTIPINRLQVRMNKLEATSYSISRVH